ncbi:MAG: pyrimidine reductase family protein [Actinobacteria bacterium]|nr:pyrimidine reductase family protein [Actinomycetota bacterium]
MDLAALYPWPEGPWLRSMMVMTLDGATVGPDGLSGSISGAADKRVFMETRRLSDAIVVGAGTIRAERYRPMVAKPEWQDARADAGLARAVQVVIVSGRLDLPWDEPLFSDSTLPVIVVTSESADTRQLAVANDHAQVWQIGATSVDLRAMVSALHERGLRRLVCEGGEALLDGLVREELVDEMDVTISPMLAGAGYLADPGAEARLPGTNDLSRFSLAHQFVEDEFTFCRFVRES